MALRMYTSTNNDIGPDYGRASHPSASASRSAARGRTAWRHCEDRDDDSPAGPPKIAIRVEALARSFGARQVLEGLSLEIAAGELVALLGASGSGKSTLLRALAGLDPAVGGMILVPRRRAVVFQEHRLLPWKRVVDNVALGLRDKAAGRARAMAVLEEVGLSDRARDWPRALSRGEAQRVALARALVRDPDLLLLDEPFRALDALTRLRSQGLVLELWATHRPAVLLVTDDVDEALQLADRVLVLSAGRISAQFAVDAPRPRRRSHPAIGRVRDELLAELGVASHG
jgi:sulfonate transport system ATP-binding protein